MVRALEPLQQFLGFSERRQSEIHRFRLKGLSRRAFRRPQSSALRAVHNLLEGFAGLANLLAHQYGDVVVESQSSAHLMMLKMKTS
jgi:hypothetical protein